jgi:uncharacterized membrane protein YdjX (TVP38/TMEM64 family)
LNLNNGFRAIKPILKGLILLLILGASVYLLRWAGLLDVLDTRWVDAKIRGHGAAGALLYIAAAGLFMTIGAPRQLLSFLGGYAFGFFWGSALAILASGLSCLTASLIARLLGREVVLRYFGKKIRLVDDFVGARPFTTAMTIRFFPIGNNLIVNLAAGVSRIRLGPFVLGSLVGYLPQTIVFALFGSGVNVSSGLQVALSVVLFLVSSFLGLSLYRRRRAERRQASLSQEKE